MRTSGILSSVSVALITLALALVLNTCGGHHRVAPPLQSGGQAFRAVIDTSVDSALAELAALETPNGVDPALFAQLKDALAACLTSNSQTPTTARFVSTPPIGEFNRIDDLGCSLNDEGEYILSWHYRNLGDYDQNGVVGISDITPIAMHYGDNVSPENEWIDGNMDGKIGINDLTPIAMYFLNDCAGYSIRGASSYPDSPDDTSEIGSVPFSNATGGGDSRKRFIVPLPESEFRYIAVVPYDGGGNLGDLSNVIVF